MGKLTQIIEWVCSALVIICIVGVMSSCSSIYQFGDISKQYCYTTNEDSKAVAKAFPEWLGVVVDVDYCSAYSLVEVVVN